MTAVTSPMSGAVIRELPDATGAEIDAAFTQACSAFAAWRGVPASRRGQLLRAVAARLRAAEEEFAQLETLNTGKPVHHTRGEAARAAAAFDYFAGWADKALGTTIPVDGPYLTYTLREPVGVVVGIVPWNVPYVFAALKIAPALAFGNAVLLKPAPETPLSAVRLAEVVAEVMAEAGLPEDVCQVLPGGAAVGRALVDDPRADLIAFTGFHETGAAIAAAAAANLTPVTLELGGKSPQLVFADADLDAAVEAVLLGIYGQAGQTCIAGSRIFVQDAVYDEVAAALASRVDELVVGDPREEGVQVGPQTTARQRDKTLAMIAAGRREGGTVAAQAPVPEAVAGSGGYYVPPTLFVDVGPEHTVMREEIFGPVACLGRFSDEDDALRKAHETPFGLAAGVWTGDLGRGHRMAAELRVGTVWVNTYRVLSVAVPFGGVGQSGYGREGGDSAVQTYTRVKAVWTALRPGLPEGYRL